MNAVTDNPLVFMDEEISSDVPNNRIFEIKDDIDGKLHKWCVLSGGNFHGQEISHIADVVALANVKMVKIFERQINYLTDIGRHKQEHLGKFDLINGGQPGLCSGFMIVQYTANALATQIEHEAAPVSVMNITSGCESEDVVSYGSHATLKLIKQLAYMNDFATVLATTALQACGMTESGKKYELYKSFKSDILPTTDDVSFDKIYRSVGVWLSGTKCCTLSELIN